MLGNKKGIKMKEKCTEYKSVIREALKVLDKKNLALILHGVSFPAAQGQDTGFGTYNSEGGKRVIDFAQGLFDAIQLGPAGKTKSSDSSPYTGTIFSENPLFIDLKALTTKAWEKLLSEKTFNEIVKGNPSKDSGRASYAYSYEKQAQALHEVYNNFTKNGSAKLREKFEKFKKETAWWLDNDALYEAFVLENGSDYWPQWKSELDKTVLNPSDEKAAAARIAEVSNKHADVIEQYKLEQFIVATQSEQTREYARERGIKMIADRQVAFSDRDCWAYQSLFLPGWSLGCPPDYFSEDGQAWGFPVMDPSKLFNPDGTLGEGGEVLKKLYIKMFTENPGGVRIDHTVGLIDPWVYKAGKLPKIEEGAGRLYSSPGHEFLKQFAVATSDDIDEEFKPDEEKWIKKLTDEQIKLYGRTIEHIVIAAAIEAGLDKDAIVAEDLGTLTYPVVQVMEKYALQGMKLVPFVVTEEADHPYRCKNITPNSWTMCGTHDNEPIKVWAGPIVNTPEVEGHVSNLMEDIFEGRFENTDDIRHKLNTDACFLGFAKLVEIFASKSQNLQIFFTDFFGIDEVYNRPGTSGDPNWTLRLPNNFEELYCQKLNSNEAPNLATVLFYAIKARGGDFVAKNAKLLKKLEGLM
jgi:4-alpha-glucanotransferase